MIGGFLFVLSNVMAMIVAAAVAQKAFGGREAWLRAFAALAAFPLVAMSALVVSHLLFHVAIGPVCGVLALAALPSAWLLLRGHAEAGSVVGLNVAVLYHGFVEPELVSGRAPVARVLFG